MARSPPCRKAPLLAAALLSAAVAPGVGAADAAAPPAPPPAQQPINLDAASTEVDGRTNTLVFTDVVISQGATRVQAEHARATGLNFANSRWTFDGKVRIDAELHGNLRSDQATIEFRDNHIARATVTGKPAEFEQKRTDSEQLARGHAGEIVYDVSDGTVRLTDDAWLTNGQNEISGSLLVYNIREQRLQAAASPGTDQRVHITITPHVAPAPGKTEPAKPPPADAGKGDPRAQPTVQP
ncbi:MAG TPA: lipopolysaccharide transport periplasmic protein LptA [Steroidobacteraceae bacterium]|nr:lipopolysaccharide transport periplasmic protein LptA [Steroidobacteraceae bacterium]